LKTLLVFHGYPRFGFARNFIAQIAAVESRNAKSRRCAGHEYTGQDFVGIATATVNIHAAVAALQVAYLHQKGFHGSGCGFFLVVPVDQRIHAAGAADGEHVVFFGIEVEQEFAFEQAFAQVFGAAKSLFFVEGKQRFQGRMRNVFGCQHRQNSRYTQSVVGPERSAPGAYPVAVYIHIDALGIEVEIDACIFGVHHIEVALQDGHGAFFMAWRSRFFDNDISKIIGEYFEAVFAAEILYPFRDAFFAFGSAGHRVEVGKGVPGCGGFELAYIGGHGVNGIECGGKTTLNSSQFK